MRTFNFSDGKLCSNLLPWWKSFFILYVQKNYYRNMALFPCSFVATSFWLGNLCARAFGSRVGTNLYGKIMVCIFKNRTTKYMKIYIYWIYTVRCTPDWHTENKSISYVLWILIVGFVFPASITIITSFVTCFQIYRVSFKVFPCAGRSFITLFRLCYILFILKYLSNYYFTVTLTHRIWWIAPLIVQKRPKSFSISFGHEHIIFVLLVSIRGCMFSTRICLKKVRMEMKCWTGQLEPDSKGSN